MKIVSTLTITAGLLTLVGFILSVSALRFDVGRAARTMWVTAAPLFVIPPIARFYASRQEKTRRKTERDHSDAEETETHQPTMDTTKTTGKKPKPTEAKAWKKRPRTQPIERRRLRIRSADPEALRQLRLELELTTEEHLISERRGGMQARAEQ